jgi:hypothetical protein
MLLNLSFLYITLQIIVYPFVVFLYAIALSIRPFTAFDYPFGNPT